MRTAITKIFLGLSATTIFLLWIAVAFLGVMVSGIMIVNYAADPASATEQPWVIFVGLFATLITALWIALGVAAGITFYYNLYDPNQLQFINWEDLD
jgi:Na+/proline symporter